LAGSQERPYAYSSIGHRPDLVTDAVVMAMGPRQVFTGNWGGGAGSPMG
jgi:hypothetical protein